MYFRADYNRLSDLSRATLNKSNELHDKYLEIIQILEDIDSNWISEDSSIYISNMIKFLNDRVIENEKIANGSYALNKIAILYGAQDDKWEKDLKRSTLVSSNKYFIKEDPKA